MNNFTLEELFEIHNQLLQAKVDPEAGKSIKDELLEKVARNIANHATSVESEATWMPTKGWQCTITTV